MTIRDRQQRVSNLADGIGITKENTEMILIPLGGKRGAVKGFTQIDEVDADLAETHWWLGSNGYARREAWIDWTTRKRETIYLHRVIAERKLGRSLALFAEHANRDRLDNRRDNLSEKTQKQ